MPRSRARNQKEPRRSSLPSTDDDSKEEETTSQGTPTALVASSDRARRQDAAPSGDDDNNAKPLATENASLSARTRERKRHGSDNNVSRKKSCSSSARVSLDAAAAVNQEAIEMQASPSSAHATNMSTITPVFSTQKRSRTQESHACPSMKAADEGDSHESSVSLARQEQPKSLPNGVVDLYPTHVSNIATTCRQEFSLSKSLNESFLMSYGCEYYQHLREQEAQHGEDNSSTNGTMSTNAESLSLAESPRSSSHHISLGSNRPVVGAVEGAGDLEFVERQPYLSVKMRAILMDWLVELSEEYNFSPKTLQLAVILVDKCLACGPPSGMLSFDVESSSASFFVVGREFLQCVGCACMWIASKIEETDPPVVMDFVYISDNSYSKEQITDMELTVCTALGFRLAQVTPFHFVVELLRASCACGSRSCGVENSLLKHMVLYLLELSILPHELAHVRPSLKAAAAVYVARVNLGIRSRDNASYWSKTLEYYSGYDISDLEETAITIHRYHRVAEESSLKGAFSKYSKKKYSCVSLKTVPLESEFGF